MLFGCSGVAHAEHLANFKIDQIRGDDEFLKIVQQDIDAVQAKLEQQESSSLFIYLIKFIAFI